MARYVYISPDAQKGEIVMTMSAELARDIHKGMKRKIEIGFGLGKIRCNAVCLSRCRLRMGEMRVRWSVTKIPFPLM